MTGSECNIVLVKTVLGMENTAASYIEELDPNARLKVAPYGLKGLIIIEASMDKYKLARLIEEKVPEAEKVLVAEACTRADPSEIAREAARIAPRFIKPDNTFAVRTVRRGRHSFTSIDVNVVAGDAVRRATGASVNLRYPDWVVAVEIVHDEAYIVFYPGSREWKKMRPGKYPLYKLFRRISIVQMPYLGPLDACRNMGVRIGREVQNFEVGELIVAPIGAVDAMQLKTFLDGLFEGIESRYEVQRKSYGREVHRVKVFVQDLYQLVRDRRNEVIIVFEPEGEYVSKAASKLYELIRSGRRVNMLFGSREGIPQGVYRFADLVLDIAPGITLSTEYAAAAALIAVASVVHDMLAKDESS
jgi:tRNA acetyltransferase TAN1